MFVVNWLDDSSFDLTGGLVPVLAEDRLHDSVEGEELIIIDWVALFDSLGLFVISIWALLFERPYRNISRWGEH